MATLEHEQSLLGGRPAAARDPHVFAAQTGRRPRALQFAGLCGAMLSLAWIAALAFALLGAGALPGALPATKAGPAPRPAVRAVERAPVRSTRGVAPRRTRAASGREVPTAATSVSTARATARASATVASTHAPVVPAAPPPPPAAPRQGWARRGWTAPPGRVKPDPSPRGADGRSAAAGDPSGTAPGQSGSHARNG
jgi:hypothetical protein